MAKRKTKRPARKRAPAKKRTAKKRATRKRTAAPKPSDPAVLDLTGKADRPTVRLPQGDFKMRLAEDLTFVQFGRQLQIFNTILELAEKDVAEEGVLEEMQGLVVEASGVLLIDLSDEAAAEITPGMYMKINDFFNGLATPD